MTSPEHSDHNVPVEDRQEQVTPRTWDPRIGHDHARDLPIADVLDQEIPVVDIPESPIGIEDERIEPIDDPELLYQLGDL